MNLSHFRRPLAILLVLGALLSLAYFLSPQSEPEDTIPLGDLIREGKAPIPPLTEATQAKLEKSTGFSALVSYTDRGFEPHTITIKRGQTIRFTNNSSNNVWIASDGTNVQIYPRTKDSCGPSDLDSCEPFAPQDFWEFTFEKPGTWEVVNNLDKMKGGMVRVE